jgi:hypothetical protein
MRPSVRGPRRERVSGLARACWVVAVLAFAAAAAGIGIPATPNEPVAVDEPQYLLTALSLVQDGDLDIANQLDARQWREFTPVEPPVETVVQPDGSQVSPHDPLLPLLLAVPVGLGGRVGAKLVLALLAGALAALTLWTAVRRFAVPLPLAVAGVGAAAASAPLAVYGQQIYPELPAALACLAGIAALTGPTRPPDPGGPADPTGRGERWALVVWVLAVVALPWLSVKYAPVAGALALLGLVRWRRHALPLAGGLVVAAGVYAVVHLAVWGGITVYASGDHFQQTGQLGVMGEGPSFLFRSWRLMDLLVDRTYGLVAWQPAWLLLIPALAATAALATSRTTAPDADGGVTDGRGRLGRAGAAVLVLPLLAGWLVATYPALTMHGYWWPGRQVVVVLPAAVLIVLSWLATARRWMRVAAAVLAAAGVVTYGCVLVDGHTGQLAWVNHYADVDAPVFQAMRPVLAHYGTTVSNAAWLVVVAALAGAAWMSARKDRHATGPAEVLAGRGRNEPGQEPGRTEARPSQGQGRPERG